MALTSRVLVGALALIAVVPASSAAVPDSARTLAYINRTWSTLTRSVTGCASYRSPYYHGRWVLYLPHDLPMPPAVRALRTRCDVSVLRLPVRITKLGGFQPTLLKYPGLLYLPHPYIVPGGMFNQMFGWDSYFIELGLIGDHHAVLARDIVENFLFEVRHYGAVLNANATFSLTRSQPPFLGEMVRDLLADRAAFASRSAATAWLRRAYPLVVKDYSSWERPKQRAGDTGLSRYFDYGGPEPALSSAKYYREVIRFLIAHPGENRGYLVRAPRHPSAAEVARLDRVSCNVRASRACARAWYGGYRLTGKYYRGDRAMRESGFDTTFRFGAFSGSTIDYAPVGLNSLLYRYALDLRAFARRLGYAAAARHWAAAAAARKRAINKYLWNSRLGLYTDYDFVTHKRSYYDFITTFYPLWAGAASKAQACAVRDNLPLFERMGGLQTSDFASGAQWDAPFGWAPTNWLAVRGLEAYGYGAAARRIARKFIATVNRVFAQDGTIREKYNMDTGNADVKITYGYKQDMIGFGWTNGVYVRMWRLLRGRPR
ncbi:MAG: trehalase family glycosidase [Steroidobacteraceae bacterium]